MKLLYKPFGIVFGILAGLVSKRIFDFIWARFDDAEPPEAEHLDVSWPKLLLANAVQGGVFRATRAGADRGSRLAFYRATGVWPGEQEPDEAKF